MNAFTFNPEKYTRNLDIVTTYIDQQSDFLSRMTGDALQTTRHFVIENMKPGGLFPLRDPKITYLAKETKGNRQFYDGHFPEDGSKTEDRYDPTILGYLKRVTDNDLLLAPTLTVYFPPKFKKSLIAEYIGQNLKLRKYYKHKMFELELQGDADGQAFYEILQTVCKIKNNSVSGAHASPSTPLYNKSSHSTLTSTCRVSTSYGNANNEKFLMGNRHYWCPDVVTANIFTIIQNTDYDALITAVNLYNVHIPTVDEVMDCITYSTNLYWRNADIMAQIREIVCSLTDHERCAFVYIGDLYHLSKHNDALVRGMISSLMIQAQPQTLDNPDEVIKSLDGYTLPLVMSICSDIIDGMSLGDLKKTNYNAYCGVASVGIQVTQIVESYRPLIEGFWKPRTLAPSIATLPSIIRRAVVTSDTDSSIFTNQYWVEYMLGRLDFSPESFKIGNITTYLTAQLVKHTLALLSANLGIETPQIHQISMKNEYYFPIFTLTSSAKHYFAYISSREGNVYKKLKLEIKGVELRSSNAPPSVMDTVKDYVRYLMDMAMTEGTMTIDQVLGPIYDLEKEIMDDFESGGYKYLRSMQIKDSESYVNKEDSSAYQQYLFWQDVFAPKYGTIESPPYQAIKVSILLGNKTKTQRWLETMEDQALADRARKWLEVNKKQAITTLMLPKTIIESVGVPKEILDVSDKRKLLMGIVSPFYLILESLGIYLKNDNMTTMVYDLYGDRKPISLNQTTPSQPPAVVC